MVAELLEFGGRIKALCIPDGQGGLDNMSVGYDTFEPYHARFNPWLGALLGRTASPRHWRAVPDRRQDL